MKKKLMTKKVGILRVFHGKKRWIVNLVVIYESNWYPCDSDEYDSNDERHYRENELGYPETTGYCGCRLCRQADRADHCLTITVRIRFHAIIKIKLILQYYYNYIIISTMALRTQNIGKKTGEADTSFSRTSCTKLDILNFLDSV